MRQIAKKYSGVIVPMVTPVDSNGKIDLAAAERIADNLIKNGTSLFVMGTTGESVSIPDEQRLAFAKKVVETTNGKTMTYAGISSNCMQNSVHFAKHYYDVGIDVVVAHLPNYYPLTNDHILKYFESLADSYPGPLIMYNIPATAHHSIPLDVAGKLARHPNIVGLKDSERDLARLEKACSLFKDNDEFSFLIGWAAQSAHGLSLGADGIVPSTGNFVPDMFRSLYDSVLKGDLETAQHYQNKTDEIAKIYQKGKTLSESLPALKIMMNSLGLCESYVLPPLLESSESVRKDIIKQVQARGII
jgi:4-hydroxy-tetrahydrodipicolinate synthase